MPQSDRLGTAATGAGVVGIGLLAMAMGFSLAPDVATVEGARPPGTGAAGMIGSPVASLVGAQSSAVWFKGFHIDGVDEPMGLLNALRAKERSGVLRCTPSLSAMRNQFLAQVAEVRCSGERLNLHATLSSGVLRRLELDDGLGRALRVSGPGEAAARTGDPTETAAR